jgi:hypothetical protein
MASVPTSQQAPLERFLASQRTKQIKPYIKGKDVLDFGCGRRAWNAVAIQQQCRSIAGVDPSLENNKEIMGIPLYRDLSEGAIGTYDVILALAVFEHIRPLELRTLLVDFLRITHSESTIIGTVPTPFSRPILELLSYRFGLIDSSQIKDHKVYYDDLWLREILDGTGWRLDRYSTFQMGMNSRFLIVRS